MSSQVVRSSCRLSSWAHSASSSVPAGGPQQWSHTLVPVISALAVTFVEARASKSNVVLSARYQSNRRPATTARAFRGHSRLSASALEAVISDVAEAKVVMCDLKEAELVVEQANESGSRVIAVCGRDGVGKSKVCAALLELGEPSAHRAPAESPHFADKARLLEPESAEERRNFSCYNHIYSQKASDGGLPQRLHLIDTPGHADRLPLVDHALRVAHGAVIVCSVRSGVDAACGRIFEAVERSGKPSVVFLNGVDEEDDADGFEEALDALEQRLGIRPVVLFAPVHTSGAHTGSLLLNVLDNTVCSALECSHAEAEEAEGTAVGELAAWAKKLRDQQIKSLAAVDEEMRLAFAEFDCDVPRVLIQSALRRAAARGLVMPLVAGSAKSGLGVDALQEVLRSFIPAADAPPLLRQLGLSPGDVHFSPEAPFLGWAFGRRCKSDNDDETLLQVRVLEGVLRPEERLKAVGRSDVFAPARLLAHGPRGELVRLCAAGPGDLVLIPAPAPLVEPGLVLAHEDRQLREGPSAPLPPVALGPCTFVLQLGGLCEDEQKRLLQALEQLAQDRDGLALVAHGTSYILSCMGALHLELLRERLAEEFAIFELPLKVAYRTTLSAGCSRASHGPAEVEVTPGSRGSGIQIEAFGSVLAEGAVCSGLEAAGPGGMRVTDIRVRLLRGDCEESAVAAAVRKAVLQAPRLALLEPIVELEVEVPQRAVEAVLEDLRGRRGEVHRARMAEGESRVVEADVPLREILDYCGALERLTSGGGFYKYRLKGYREVESALAEHILEHEVAVAHKQRPALVDVACAEKFLVA